MTTRSDERIRSEYPDLAPAGADPRLVRLLRTLDAAYDPEDIPDAAVVRRKAHARAGNRHTLRTSIWTRFAVAAAIIVVFLTVHGYASGDLADLGKPTNDVPGTYDSLANFQTVNPALHVTGKVPITLYDTLWDKYSAAGRWPIVKALGLFGTWSGLAKGASAQTATTGDLTDPAWTVPTINLTHAKLTSPYLTLRYRVMQKTVTGAHTRLPAAENAVFNRTLRLPPWQTDQRVPLPAVLVGRYGMHGILVNPDDMTIVKIVQHPLTRRSFEEVQHIWQTDDVATNYWIAEGNTFVNIVAAYVCSQDGHKPASVCNRFAVKYISKRIK